MEIELEGAFKEVSVKALELLLSESDAGELHESARKLLSSLQADLPWRPALSSASLEGEALATALEDYQDSGKASVEETEMIDEMLSWF